MSEVAEDQIIGWACRDGEEDWYFYDAGSDVGKHITQYQKEWHGVTAFPIWKNPGLSLAAPELLEALQVLLPRQLNSDNPNVSDDLVIPIDLTMGEIRAARAAISKATNPQHKAKA